MRYQKIHSQIWHDEKFIKLSQDAKFLFLYILTSPHSNMIGIYILPKEYICADLKLQPKSFAKSFAELLKADLILYDENINLICIPNHTKHNPIINENHSKAAIKILQALPKSPLFSSLQKSFTKSFHKSLRELIAILYANPEEEEEEEEVTETEEEKEVFGEFLNVKLLKVEYEKLIQKYGEDKTKTLIENLSTGIESKGYKYKSHYATILNWEKREQGKKPETNLERITRLMKE